MTSRSWFSSSPPCTPISRRRTAGSNSVLRRYEVATAAMLMAIAAVAMLDTRRGALPDPTGNEPGGLGSGFYPFWAAALIFVAGIAVAYRAFVVPLPAQGVFKDWSSITTVLTLILPIIIAVSLLKWIGLYVMTGAYMAYFALTIGRYKWYWALIVAVLLPAAIYAAFELGFRVPLPKSIFSSVLRF